MSLPLHHIRLLAGFELASSAIQQRQIDREHCQPLLEALAKDLARVCPDVESGMLVLGGSLLEPDELLQPSDPVWSALQDLAAPVVRQHGCEGQLLAIGAHQGRLPDRRLQARQPQPQGAFLTLPLMLVIDQSKAPAVARRLEEALFETGSIGPPARALLAERCGIDTVHGQLLTRHDLMALQHVQMDTAGLGAFWPLVEQILIDPDSDHAHQLVVDWQARWVASQHTVLLAFESLNTTSLAIDDYARQLGAFRAMISLLELHGIAWALDPAPEGLNEAQSIVKEVAGPGYGADGITVQLHQDCGLIAWTVQKNRHLEHWYPVNAAGFEQLQAEVQTLGLPLRHSEPACLHDGQLAALTEPPHA